MGLIAAVVALLASLLGGSMAVTGPCTSAWRDVGHTDFASAVGAIRSQGVTTDGQQWWFSWQGGLSRANNAYNTILASPIAIPPALAAAGSNHIGDIDFDRGRLIAPIEDGHLAGVGSGPEYQHPWLVFYNAKTLLPTGARYELPQSLQRDGVPWVAVDHAHHLAITAEWDNTKVLNFWAIDNGMHLVRQLPLARTVGRIQGAKVLGDWLYAARDDDLKSVVRINLSTGAVEDLYQFRYVGEQEGIAIRHTADDALLHVLVILGSATDPTHFHVSLHHLAPPCSFSP